jgi:transposase
MERYLGLDVHAASCTLAVVSEKGRKLRDFPVETNGQALVEAVRMIPGHKHLVFEEGLQSAWLYETLVPHVDEILVAGVTQSRGPKSDKRDAYGLAEKLRVGNLDKTVFKSPRQFTRLRDLSRSHMTLVVDVVRAQARIKSLYRSRGILVAGVNVYAVRQRKEWQEQLCASAQTRATRLYDPLDFLLEQKKQAEADLLREGKKHAIVRILETAPGFGPIRAGRLVPVVITPHRFRTKRQFWSYCGLGIASQRSWRCVATPCVAHDSIELRLGPGRRRRLDPGACPSDKRSLSSAQSRLEGHLQGCSDDGDHAAQQGSHVRTLRTASRRWHEANTREAELGPHDCSDRAANVEGREGVRPRTRRSVDNDTRRLGEDSIGRIEEKAIRDTCIGEECSHATLCVAAEASIHERPGLRPKAWRS